MNDGGQRSLGALGDVLVIIPTYNEADNIEAIVTRVRKAVPDVHVLVADDNSPDGTGKIADDLAADDKHVHVLHRQGKQGLGAAYLAGFRWGIEHGYDVLCEMDADGSHQPEELPRLLTALRNADLVIGSRWMPGGRVVNWPRNRELLSRGASTYSRLLLGVPTRDVTAGYRAFRKEALLGLGMADVASQGYCFQIDLTRRALAAGYRVVEVPITFVERERGDSKMSRDIIAEAVWRVAAWGAQDRVRRVLGRGRDDTAAPGGRETAGPEAPQRGERESAPPRAETKPESPGKGAGPAEAAESDGPGQQPEGPQNAAHGSRPREGGGHN
ncbi:polyprenol monophosphomannose synthase [Streptomyces capparidis]